MTKLARAAAIAGSLASAAAVAVAVILPVHHAVPASATATRVSTGTAAVTRGSGGSGAGQSAAGAGSTGAAGASGSTGNGANGGAGTGSTGAGSTGSGSAGAGSTGTGSTGTGSTGNRSTGSGSGTGSGTVHPPYPGFPGAALYAQTPIGDCSGVPHTTDNGPVTYSISVPGSEQAYLSLTPLTGTLQGGASQVITATLIPNPNGPPPAFSNPVSVDPGGITVILEYPPSG